MRRHQPRSIRAIIELLPAMNSVYRRGVGSIVGTSTTISPSFGEYVQNPIRYSKCKLHTSVSGQPACLLVCCERVYLLCLMAFFRSRFAAAHCAHTLLCTLSMRPIVNRLMTNTHSMAITFVSFVHFVCRLTLSDFWFATRSQNN